MRNDYPLRQFKGTLPVYLTYPIGQPNHSESFLIRKMMCGINRQRLSPDTRLPICDSMMFPLIDITYGLIKCAIRSKLLRAMFLLAFHAFLRVGEFTVHY